MLLLRKHFASTQKQEGGKISLVIFHWNFLWRNMLWHVIHEAYTEGAVPKWRSVVDAFRLEPIKKLAHHPRTASPCFIFCTVNIHEILNVSKFCCQSSLPHEYNTSIFLRELRCSDRRRLLHDVPREELCFMKHNTVVVFYGCTHKKINKFHPWLGKLEAFALAKS